MKSKYIQLIQIMSGLDDLPFKLTVGEQTLIFIRSSQRLEIIVVKLEGSERTNFILSNNEELDAKMLENVLAPFDIPLHIVDIEEDVLSSLMRELRYSNLSTLNDNLREMSAKYQERYSNILTSVFSRQQMLA